jgi:carboxypeptidase T
MLRLTVPAVALVAVLAAAAPASAAQRARTYQLDGVRTAIDRAAVAASGAAIVEVDHAYVVVTATPREIRFLTRRGYRAHRLAPPPRRGRPGIRARRRTSPRPIRVITTTPR